MPEISPHGKCQAAKHILADPPPNSSAATSTSLCFGSGEGSPASGGIPTPSIAEQRVGSKEAFDSLTPALSKQNRSPG